MAEHADAAFVSAIAAVPLFADLTPTARDQLAAASSLERVPAGAVVVREGEAGFDCFVVRSGLFEVIAGDGTSRRRIRQLRQGSTFGELSLLSGAPRTATVRAVRDSEVWRISAAGFDALLDDLAFSRAINHALTRLALETEPATDRRGEPNPPSVIAAVAGHSAAPVAAVADAFGSAIPNAVAIGPDVVETKSWGRRVDELEQSGWVVVLNAPEPDGDWHDFCTREADRVAVVVDAATATARSHPGIDVDLVIWGAPRRADLARLIDDHQPRAHHIVAAHAPAEALARAAHRIAARSIGVVLSGGGARGLAHVGVLKAIGATGITIDRYGGTSMGALVGALAARGLTPDAIAVALRRELVDRRPFADYGLPRFGLIRAQRARAMLQRLLGDSTIEALPHDYFCVSADLVAAETVVHRRGGLVEAVGASMSLPGLAPPRRVGERILVDGGVLDNLPVATMRTSDEGPIIAVDVLGRGAAGARPRHRPGQLPSIVETLARSATLSSHRDAPSQRALATVTISPDLAGIGLLDFGRFDDAVAAGRTAADRALASIDLRPAG